MINKYSILLLSTLFAMSTPSLCSMSKLGASGCGPHMAPKKHAPVIPATGIDSKTAKENPKQDSPSSTGSAPLAGSPTKPAITIPSGAAAASIAITSPTQSTVKEELLEFPEGKGLSNWWWGTHANVLAFMREHMGKNQRLNPDSAYNQKVLASAVANLVRPANDGCISEFLSLASTPKFGKPTAKIDPTVRRQLRANRKEQRAKKMEELYEKLNEQAKLTESNFIVSANAMRAEYEKNMAELAKIYNEGVAVTNGLNVDIDRTYELADRSARDGADSDNEESHPSFVDKTRLVGVKPENLITVRVEKLIGFKALGELFKLTPSSKNKKSPATAASKK